MLGRPVRRIWGGGGSLEGGFPPIHKYTSGPGTSMTNETPSRIAQDEQQTLHFSKAMRPSQRVMLLGLCTSAEISALKPDTRSTLLHRLCRVLLNRTTENTIFPGEYLGEGFECSTLDAFEYAGLDISSRTRACTTIEQPDGGTRLIEKDEDVGALLWISRLLHGDDPQLDLVVRTCAVLWANWARSRLVGRLMSKLWVREMLWNTVTAVITYIECLRD